MFDRSRLQKRGEEDIYLGKDLDQIRVSFFFKRSERERLSYFRRRNGRPVERRRGGEGRMGRV